LTTVDLVILTVMVSCLYSLSTDIDGSVKVSVLM